jgi:hypothetical protein
MQPFDLHTATANAAAPERGGADGARRSEISDPAVRSPGPAWSTADVARWSAAQPALRSYAQDVLRPVAALAPKLTLVPYGHIAYGADHYPLQALRSPAWHPHRPAVLVTGGVHGYETSGVHGALRFAQAHADAWAGRVNLLVVPCVSPWAYERIHRWNAHAVDPNRSFRRPCPAAEAAALMDLVAQWGAGRGVRWLAHFDLHETTDTDETVFRPLLAQRDGQRFEPGSIPDGFYLVGDSERPQLPFQQAMVQAVARVTHIAPPDADGRLIGAVPAAHGVVLFAARRIGYCASVSDATYTTTTEVYPDSPRTTPEQCVQAQVAAVVAGIDFALHESSVTSD